MKNWKSRQIGPNEWHVIETRFVNEPEYILARCTGPVPAEEIVIAMRLSQSIDAGTSSIHNSLFSMKDQLERFKSDLATAREAK